MDQLNVEKKGIPTVTIATTAFEKPAQAAIAEQGVATMALVIEPHPIAGHNADAIRKKAEVTFPRILEAATKWQPAAK